MSTGQDAFVEVRIIGPSTYHATVALRGARIIYERDPNDIAIFRVAKFDLTRAKRLLIQNDIEFEVTYDDIAKAEQFYRNLVRKVDAFGDGFVTAAENLHDKLDAFSDRANAVITQVVKEVREEREQKELAEMYGFDLSALADAIEKALTDPRLVDLVDRQAGSTETKDAPADKFDVRDPGAFAHWHHDSPRARGTNEPMGFADLHWPPPGSRNYRP